MIRSRGSSEAAIQFCEHKFLQTVLILVCIRNVDLFRIRLDDDFHITVALDFDPMTTKLDYIRENH